MPHFLQLTDWSVEDIHKLLDHAEAIEAKSLSPKIDAFVVNLFFEPSTRTRFSFEVAEKRLGMNVLNFSAEASSTKKGETLYDTLRTIESMGVEIAVIRHPEEGYYNELKNRLHIKIVNGGDGAGHHPSQTMLDLMTIRQEFGTFEGLTIAMIGDISHSRVARSNAMTLQKLGAHVIFSGPPEWQNEEFPGTYVSMDEAIQKADVVNMLRIQTERHGGTGNGLTKGQYHEAYGLTVARTNQMKPEAIIMHPGPFNRGVEIADELVEHPKSRIFKQVHNGVAVRMAVLEWAMTTEEKAVIK